jgi:hypothetical protein
MGVAAQVAALLAEEGCKQVKLSDYLSLAERYTLAD